MNVGAAISIGAASSLNADGNVFISEGIALNGQSLDINADIDGNLVGEIFFDNDVIFTVNAGDILTGDATVESKGREIYELFLRVASGEASKSEAQGLGDYEFVPWQIGAVM